MTDDGSPQARRPCAGCPGVVRRDRGGLVVLGAMHPVTWWHVECFERAQAERRLPALAAICAIPKGSAQIEHVALRPRRRRRRGRWPRWAQPSKLTVP